MNLHANDHPDLTAHVLGELDADHAKAMAQWLAQHPEAEAEARQIQELAQTLHETAPVSFHTLLPQQREAVLSGPQRVRQMVAAARQPVSAPRRANPCMPVLWGLAGTAAAAAIALAGFVAGLHSGQGRTSTAPDLASLTPPANPAADLLPSPHVAPFKAQPVPEAPAETHGIAEVKPMAEIDPPAPAPVVATVQPFAAPSPPARNATPSSSLVAALPKVELPAVAKPAPQPKKTVMPQPANVVFSQPFTNAAKSANAQVTLRPARTRPAASVQEGAGPVAAALSTAVNNPKPQLHTAAKQPELMIHSWKAEVASCPWDESHRLLRVVVQMPGEQPAAEMAAAAYPLQVSFSPAAVRSFRVLGERTLPAAQSDSPAFHIAWFEVVPNGPVPEHGPRTLGDILLPNARFTTQAMAPFDGSRLHVLDRGQSWQNAREDFLFESAVVGFGLLLKGERDAAGLTPSLVLDLAERAKGDDPQGERGKFIKLVKDARRITGAEGN